MIGNKDIQELVSYDGSGLVLSAYLDTDLSAKPKDAVKLDLRRSLKELPVEPAEADVEAIIRYLDYEFAWHTRGLALFAADGAIWKAIALPVAVPAQTYYAAFPYMRPLVDFKDRYGDYVVAVLDGESIRLFSVSGGKISPETEAYGEQLKHHKQGGWAAARYQRHDDNIALHNLKQAIELLESFFADTGYTRLILAGNDETLKQAHDMLPGALRKMVIAEFNADVRIAPLDVLNTTQDLLQKSDQARESRLVTETITAASKGGAGVRGLGDALYTMREGRMRQLLVSDTVEAAGHACTTCHYLAVEPFSVCPFCGGREVTGLSDVVNEAIVRALKSDVVVNVIRNNQELDAAGGVAAVLRY